MSKQTIHSKRPMSRSSKSPKSPSSEAKLPIWNLRLLYDSDKDPRIEKDLATFEKNVESFVEAYDRPVSAGKSYLEDESVLLSALKAYEKLVGQSSLKPFLYFYYLRDIEADNPTATSMIPLMENRLAKVQNKLAFFEISLGTVPIQQQVKLLHSQGLSSHKVFMSRVFDDAK